MKLTAISQEVIGKKVVMVNGIPASGKSSISKPLSCQTGWPILSIDSIKEPFMSRINKIDRDFNRLLSQASYQAIWSIIAEAPEGTIFIVDAWFGFQPKAVLESYLVAANVTHLAELWCQISSISVAERYESRLNQRMAGHPGKEYIPELKALADHAKPMGLCPVYHIDQSKDINMDHMVTWIRRTLLA